MSSPRKRRAAGAPGPQARNAMTPWVATIGAGATVREAARVMIERRVSALPVLDEKDRLVGIVSEGDLVRRAELGTDAARLLEKHAIKRLPVVRAGRLVGILSRADLVRRLAAAPAPSVRRRTRP